jgi:hypothetical protein
MLPAKTRKKPGMKPGSVPAKPGIVGAPMLTDVKIRKAKAADKPYKLTDGGGLHVYVTPAGGKLWRLRYELERKEKLLSIGPYPSVGLAEAREVATNAKRLLREGKDPAVEKRLRRLQIVTDGGTTFEVVARVNGCLDPRKDGAVACRGEASALGIDRRAVTGAG